MGIFQMILFIAPPRLDESPQKFLAIITSLI
jgi:hypothetical protein